MASEAFELITTTIIVIVAAARLFCHSLNTLSEAMALPTYGEVVSHDWVYMHIST